MLAGATTYDISTVDCLRPTLSSRLSSLLHKLATRWQRLVVRNGLCPSHLPLPFPGLTASFSAGIVRLGGGGIRAGRRRSRARIVAGRRWAGPTG